jgi:hypothetical protein
MKGGLLQQPVTVPGRLSFSHLGEGRVACTGFRQARFAIQTVSLSVDPNPMTSMPVE